MEEWKATEVDGYEVSDLGRVRSLERDGFAGFRRARIGGRILKQWITKHGYAQVELAGKTFAVHRLVAMAFHSSLEGRDDVNHVDGDRANNVAMNLEWVTPSENMSHSYRDLGRRGPCTGLVGGDHPASRPVRSVDMKTGAVRDYPSIADAVLDGFYSSNVSKCCRGKCAHHKGRTWMYIEEAA